MTKRIITNNIHGTACHDREYVYFATFMRVDSFLKFLSTVKAFIVEFVKKFVQNSNFESRIKETTIFFPRLSWIIIWIKIWNKGEFYGLIVSLFVKHSQSFYLVRRPIIFFFLLKYILVWWNFSWLYCGTQWRFSTEKKILVCAFLLNYLFGT